MPKNLIHICLRSFVFFGIFRFRIGLKMVHFVRACLAKEKEKSISLINMFNRSGTSLQIVQIEMGGKLLRVCTVCCVHIRNRAQNNQSNQRKISNKRITMNNNNVHASRLGCITLIKKNWYYSIGACRMHLAFRICIHACTCYSLQTRQKHKYVPHCRRHRRRRRRHHQFQDAFP